VADEFQPDVIVGSSFGGVLALKVHSNAGRVLVAPARRVILKGVEYPNPLAREQLPVHSVILHAEDDELVPFEASKTLVENAARAADPAAQATMVVIQQHLRELGYDVVHGRLIAIGRGHRCNAPHPADTRNRNPDPLHAMVEAVMVLALCLPIGREAR
jgi:dienelactone hydrolase